MRRLIPLVLVILCGVPVVPVLGEQRCEGPLARPEADFSFLAGGAQVLDSKTGLIWMRCIEGQRWTGTSCLAEDPNAVNPGPRLTYAQARQLAASRSTTEEPWRIPTRAELVSLREPGCYNPSMSLRLFPTIPAWSSDGSFWTSTPEGQGVSLVSAIGTSDSWSATTPDKLNHVRLVRTQPKDHK